MQPLSWYVNRLRFMSPHEIVYRSAVTVRDIRDGIIQPKHFHHACSDPLKKGSSRPPVRFYFGSLDLKAMEPVLKETLPEIEAHANALSDHQFTFLGVENMYWGNPIRWCYDPTQKIESPRKPAHRLDYRNVDQAGEVKYIWELNRHQHLPFLALAFLLSGKERYATEVVGQLRDWIHENPYPMGINWTSALEAGMRLISWSWVCFLLKASGRELPEAFFRSLGEQCGFIHRKFSLYSSKGNHLVGEGSGLFIASLLFAVEPYRSSWMSDAYRILTKQIEEQVNEDGSHVELSIGYHRFVTELFLLPALLGKINNVHFPGRYWKKLDAMIRYIYEMQDSAGGYPDVGDNDAGRCLYFDTLSPHSNTFLLTTGALLFNNPCYLRGIQRPDSKTLITLGKDSHAKFCDVKKEEENVQKPGSKIFKNAGYCILTVYEEGIGDIRLLFDHGPVGMEPMAGHGHADVLSFTLSLDGKAFFVDPGTYTYRAGDMWRMYFRGTSAHNTVRIDEQDQSVSRGTFMWARKAIGRLVQWKPDAENPVARAAHDGYTRLKDPVEHTREIRLERKERRILIQDEIMAKASHRIEIFFHLHPLCEIRKEKDTLWIHRDGKRIGLVKDPRMESRIVKGGTDPILGWYSKSYGKKEPTHTLVTSHLSVGDTAYRTRILL